MPQPTSRPDFKKFTTSLAAKLGWWWRKEANLKKVRAESHEWPAMLYEIGRRVAPDDFPEAKALDQTWPRFIDLPDGWQAEFAIRWPDPNLKLGGPIFEVRTKGPTARRLSFPGCTKPVVFNLGHTTAALTSSFLQFIRGERERLSLEPQIGRGKKPLPWESVEMFDVQQFRKTHPKAAPGVTLDYSSIAKMKKLWQRAKE